MMSCVFRSLEEETIIMAEVIFWVDRIDWILLFNSLSNVISLLIQKPHRISGYGLYDLGYTVINHTFFQQRQDIVPMA